MTEPTSMDNHNPQEAPPLPPGPSHGGGGHSPAKQRRLPTCIFDLFFDLPHPAASTTDRAKIVEPPVTVSPPLAREMCNPDNVARLSRLAFPEHDDHHGDSALQERREKLTSAGRTFGAHLTRHDVYHVDFSVHHHTFALLLSDGTTRVHGHARRYLPAHGDSASRMDVGRRRPRAMILLTRAVGGERFYSSVLKTAESISLESQVNRKGCFAKKKDPIRSFLHALFNKHATLITQYAELRRHGLSLNFTQAPSNTGGQLEGKSACDIAKAVMEENEDLFRITLDKVEFGTGGKKGAPNRSKLHIHQDTLQFYLPPTLQPGFECLSPGSTPEDIASPIIPLLRYVGPSHLVRLLSALLCERRIILISKSITRLSVCVRAASSVLAQGLLLWKHILIPIVPPHMIRFLAVKAPYLVGILHPFASRLGKIDGLTDVLCVNIDKNELKTLNMNNPRLVVPDMLKKVGRKSDSEPYAVEMLARDLDEIVKADQTLWQQEGGGTEKAKEGAAKALDTSETSRVDAVNPSKQSILEKMKHPMKKHVSNAKRIMSAEEKREYQGSVDAAVAFGKMIRSTFQRDLEDEDFTATEDDNADQAEAPKYAAPSHETDIGSVEASIVAENEGAEEDLRAALTCFFIHMYGDMGMYLSETSGTFWLDRRKFLLRKKQLGEKENSPVFLVLQKFSASTMFAVHVKGRIDDMSMTARDRSNIMPHHIPLFDVCSKYLSVHRLDFSLINVRRIVAKTVLACTRHIVVERHVATRARALALTEDALFDGNVAEAIAELVDSCHECNTTLSVVMSVIWHRLNQTKTNMPILLALKLLKNLVSNGPLTAITEALDGAGKIYELKSFSDSKNAREVRQAADHMYGLLVDLPSLFGRRRRLAFSKVRQNTALPKDRKLWQDYLVRSLPVTIEAQKLHALFCPDGMSGAVLSYDDDASFAPSVAASQTPSVMALSRLHQGLREAKVTAPLYDADEEDRLFGPLGDEYLNDESMENRDLLPFETAPVDDMRSDPSSIDVTREELAAPHSDVAEELFSEQNDFYSEQSEGDGADMLERFNYAVSSHGGSQSGSHFGSERSSSPPPSSRDTRGRNLVLGSIEEGMTRRSSLPAVLPHKVLAGENEAFETSSYDSGLLHASGTDRHPFLA